MHKLFSTCTDIETPPIVVDNIYLIYLFACFRLKLPLFSAVLIADVICLNARVSFSL